MSLKLLRKKKNKWRTLRKNENTVNFQKKKIFEMSLYLEELNQIKQQKRKINKNDI